MPASFATRLCLFLLLGLLGRVPATYGHSNTNSSFNQIQLSDILAVSHVNTDVHASPSGSELPDPFHAHSDQLVDLEDDTDYLEGFNSKVSGEILYGFSRGKSFYYKGLPDIVGTIVIPPPEVVEF